MFALDRRVFLCVCVCYVLQPQNRRELEMSPALRQISLTLFEFIYENCIGEEKTEANGNQMMKLSIWLLQIR